jgi:hypothetical protein
VLWAHELDDKEQNAKLLTYYADRTVWLVQPDEAPSEIVPYTPADKP